MKRLLILGACALLLAATGIFLYLRYQRHDIVITQKQVDDALRKSFPISETYLYVFEVTYENPRANLLPNTDRVEIGLDAKVAIKLPNETREFKGTAAITASLGYRDETKQLFLTDPQIAQLSLPGIPQKYLDKATGYASELARKYVQQIPIYTVNRDDATSTAAKLLVRDVKIQSGAIYVKLGL